MTGISIVILSDTRCIIIVMFIITQKRKNSF